MSQANQEMRTNLISTPPHRLLPELDQYRAVNPECKSTSENPRLDSGFPFAYPLVGR